MDLKYIVCEFMQWIALCSGTVSVSDFSICSFIEPIDLLLFLYSVYMTLYQLFRLCTTEWSLERWLCTMKREECRWVPLWPIYISILAGLGMALYFLFPCSFLLFLICLLVNFIFLVLYFRIFLSLFVSLHLLWFAPVFLIWPLMILGRH